MRRQWLLGAGVALVTVIVGVAIVLLATSGDGGSTNAAGSQAGDTTTTTKKSKDGSTTTTTTTTSPGGATTPSSAARTSPTTAKPGTTDATDPPDPADAYQPIPMPAGVTGTITSCTWSPASGGMLDATGTVTNIAGDDDAWLVTAYWLKRNGNQNEEIDEDTDLLDIAVGQTITWHLSTAAAEAPPNLSCALEVE
ncbi:MAG: hypothetical protein ACXV8R_09405 [Acidimicrobiia bacterium]